MSAADELGAALATAQRSVFRLEAHQDYPDDELWVRHQQGDTLWEQDRDMVDWCALVSATVDRGASWIRVRVVIEPWTPYTRWEIEQHYPHNLRAGEDVRLVREEHPPDAPDFWLVDDRAWLLAYDGAGEMTVVEAQARALPFLRECRDESLSRAEPLPMSSTP